MTVSDSPRRIAGVSFIASVSCWLPAKRCCAGKIETQGARQLRQGLKKHKGKGSPGCALILPAISSRANADAEALALQQSPQGPSKVEFVSRLAIGRTVAASRGANSPALNSLHTAGTVVALCVNGQRYRAGRLQRELLASRLCRESGGVTPTAQMTQAIGRKRAEVQGSAPIVEGCGKHPTQFSSGAVT